jgi:S-disulfanyl-L-cysteine oxidoreductase SoxD
MLKSAKYFALTAVLVLAAGPALGGSFGLGQEASPAEVSAWDIDVRPDGQGLPEGRGTVAQGEVLFQERCTVCHGEFGEGAGRWPVLAGGFETLNSDNPVKTIGSYWPYLSTVFDYIRRAMPFGDAQSLTVDETYALTALLLNLNEIVDEDFELTNENFTSIKLGNESGFIPDDRPDTPGLSAREPCMTDCKPEVVIRQRARVLDVTPDSNDTSAVTSD